MSSILTIIAVLLFFQVIVIQVLSRTRWRGVAYYLSLVGTWLTFPGVILREASHKLFCDLAGVPVHEAKYFTLKYPCGYVLHDKVSRYRDAFLLTAGPFVVNSAFAIAMFIPPCFDINIIVSVVLIWLGISFAANAFPGDGDAQGLWRQSKRAGPRNPIASLGLPLVIVIGLAQRLRKHIRVNLLYAAILYSVTFCLIAAVLIAGSAVFSDAYAVKITSLSDNSSMIGPGGNYTGNYHVPTIHRPTTIKDVSGSEAPAKDWLHAAQEAMKDRNDDAVLIMVRGYSDYRGTSLPVNGKCHWWTYEFASKADNRLYKVNVHDGVVGSIDESDIGSTGVEGILYKYGDPTITSWKVDSLEAVESSNLEFKNMTGKDMPPSAAYTLELRPWGELSWTICCYDSTSTVIANIDVDPETGKVIRTWRGPGKA